MKKQIILQAIFLLFSCLIFGQNLEITWQQCNGGSNDDHVYDIISIDDGYFLVGSTESNDGDINYNHGSWDAWLVKIDSTGNILWEKTYGGSDGDGCGKIIPTTNNNFYLICASGSNDGDINYDPYPGSNDIWVVKIDSMGNILWDKIIGGGMIDAIESATLTTNGGVVVFGWTGSQNGDITVNYGMYDMWMVKLDSDGKIEWDKSFGTDDFDYGRAVIQTSDGGFLVGGTSTIGYGGNLTCEPYNINAEAILLKLDSLGNIEWQNCYGGSSHDGFMSFLEQNDGYLLLGYGESADGDLTDSGWHGESDNWVIKIDFFGNIIWQKCYGGSRHEFSKNIFQGNDGSIFIIGQTESNNGDVSGNHTLSEYDNDIWFVKLSSEGELLYQKCFGGLGDEEIEFGVVQKNDNDYVVAAYTDYGPSYDVACTPHGGNAVDRDWWLFEIKDCSQYPVGNVQTPTGPDTTCTVYDSTNVYAIGPATGAWEYGWRLVPEEAGTINGNGLTATVNWATGWEGIAGITARAMNDCDTTQWSAPKYTQVFTCLGINELRAGDVRLKVYPNPARGFVVFELPTAPNKNAVISTTAGRRKPPTPTGPAGKPHGTSGGQKSKGVSHSTAQSQAQGFDMTAKKGAVVVILNVFGQQVAELPLAQGKTIWRTGSVENGIYFYRVEIEGEVLSGKVIVQ